MRKTAVTTLLIAIAAVLVPRASGVSVTRFVVSPDQKTDATHFHKLKTALTTNGLAPGSVIQIEQGAFPGSIADADVDNAQVDAGGKLTIKGIGDIGTLNAISLTDALTLSHSDLKLQNLRINNNAGIIQAQPGADRFTIDGCKIVNTTTLGSGNGVVELRATLGKVIDSTIDSHTGGATSSLILVGPVANASNLVKGNTLVSSSANPQSLISYLTAGSLTSTNDQILENRLLGAIANQALVTIGGKVKDVTIEGNTLTGSDDSVVGIGMSLAQNIVIRGNSIKLSGLNATRGIRIDGGVTDPTSATIDGNTIKTKGTGVGISLSGGSTGSLDVLIQNNVLGKNPIAIAIDAGGGASVAGVDIGGGPLSSVGHNSFTGITAPATTSAAAILTSASTADGPISAKHNTFSVPDPETVVFDQQDNAALANVVTS